MKKEKVQSVTKGIKENVDNFVLQMILKMVKEAKLKEDEMITLRLDKCPFSEKQRIYIEDAETRNCDIELCVFCEKPADVRVIVYEFKPDDKAEDTEQVICLESEAEELVK